MVVIKIRAMDDFKEDSVVFYSDLKSEEQNSSTRGNPINDEDIIDDESKDTEFSYGYTGRASHSQNSPVTRKEELQTVPVDDRSLQNNNSQNHKRTEAMKYVNTCKTQQSDRKYSPLQYTRNYDNNRKNSLSAFVKVIGIILAILLIIFIIKGDTAYSAVTALIIIMYVMNFLNNNKKGPRRG